MLPTTPIPPPHAPHALVTYFLPAHAPTTPIPPPHAPHALVTYFLTAHAPSPLADLVQEKWTAASNPQAERPITTTPQEPRTPPPPPCCSSSNAPFGCEPAASLPDPAEGFPRRRLAVEGELISPLTHS
ncbi:arabinogalactan protein 1-like [Penaeus chinensis]|uniref:arabinogalactan protein 1-like n=1 Tax=Penaeus chinensis TaxID=139456 RepID=UPI001FB816A3|nr:arabinogalactan protein 1-like [Penaeus chinensis]